MLFVFSLLIVLGIFYIVVSAFYRSDFNRINEAFLEVSTSKKKVIQLVLASLISVTALLTMVLRDTSWREEPEIFSLSSIVMGFTYLWLVRVVRSERIGRNMFCYLVMLGMLQMILSTGLWHSDDLNRYILEGQQIINNYNPYAIPPNASVNHNLVDHKILERINHPDMTAIYPPVSLFIHGVLALISPSVFGFKVLTGLGACLLVLCSLLLILELKKPPAYISIVLWNPVLIIFGVGEAHNDIWVALLLTLFVYFAVRKKVLISWVTLSLAIFCKPFAGIVLPWYIFKNPKGWWVFPSIAIVLVMPFLNAGYGLVRSLFSFGHDMHFHGALEPLIRFIYLNILPNQYVSTSVRITLIIFLLLGGIIIWKASVNDNLANVSVNFIALLLWCLPTLHPWYFLILLPFLPFAKGLSLIVWTSMVGVYWLHGIKMQTIGEWTEDPVVTLLAHIPALILLAWESRGIVLRKFPKN